MLQPPTYIVQIQTPPRRARRAYQGDKFEGRADAPIRIKALFDATSEALTNLICALGELGVAPPHFEYMNITDGSPQQNQEPCVFAYWNGAMLLIQVSDLHLWPDRLPMFIGRHYGVSEQVALEFIQRLEDSGQTVNKGAEVGIYMAVECNHAGCQNRKSIYAKTPREMSEAKARANSEIWYCHCHWQPAWERDGALADYMLQMLWKIGQSPGINQTGAGGKRNELNFLQAAGLIEIRTRQHLAGRVAYQHFLTDAGKALLESFMLGL